MDCQAWSNSKLHFKLEISPSLSLTWFVMVFILKIIILNNHNANKFYFISYLHDFQFLYR